MKPFTSLDGEDKNGVRAQVHVQVGEGTITSIENLDDESKQNVQVIIQSSHAAVKKPIKSWLQRSDPLFAQVVDAFNAKRVVVYRTESQRKGSVDRTLPIEQLRSSAEVAQENCISIFAGMDGTLSLEAVTNPSEDPAPGGRNSANAPGQGQTRTNGGSGGGAAVSVDAALKAVADARNSDLPEGVTHAAMAQALAAGATVQQVQSAGVNAQTQQTVPQQQSAFATEGRSYKAHNSDGRINLGSYAVQAVFGCERFAVGLITAQQAAALEEGVEAEPVDLAQAAGLAEVLIGLADRVQSGSYGGSRPDRLAPSHTRARALVFDAIETRHPVPFGAEPDDRETWMTAVVEECVERFKHLASLAVQASQAPQQQVAQAPPAQQQAAAPVTDIQQAPSAQAAAAEKPKPIVEGQEGFVAPDDALLKRFAGLATAAGFEPKPGGPIVDYLQQRFGVTLVRAINAADLNTLITWYESKGDEAGATFKTHVMAAAA